MDKKIAHLMESWHEELTAAYLYGFVVARETGINRKLFENLKIASEKQAGMWAKDLEGRGIVLPAYHPPARARLAALLLRWIHPRHLLPMLASMKVRGLGMYRSGVVIASGAGKDDPALIQTAAEERRHRAGRGGGALRAAVFGINDGLVSNASLIIGVMGAGTDPRNVLVAGTAGLLAGGFSMAAGEYISVRTQREMYEQQIALEKEEIETMPEEEIAELAEIYHAKGLSYDQANVLARKMISNPETGLDTLAREELGLDPQNLSSPWAAAGSSFTAFVVGALVPLIPHFLVEGQAAFFATAGLSLLALLLIGAIMSLFTGKSAVVSALRMAFIGLLAGGATFMIGKWFGVAAP